MKKRSLINSIKKIAAGSLAAVLVMSGLTLTPKAAGTEKNVHYEEVESATDYWKKDGEKIAPVKDGYVFGGWYDAENGNALTEVSGSAYAKFVPASVLSVKVQTIADGENAITESTSAPNQTELRLLSSVDQGDYQYCGFQLLYGAKELKPSEEKHITKVYQKIEFGNNQSLTASDTFGTGAEYFFALNITPIYKNSFASKIHVRPYWVTLDGTTVYGLAKNVRIEDNYTDYNYYSMSVNLLGNEAIAAGKVKVTFDATKYTLVGDTIETGRVLEEMDSHANNGTIIIVGNAKTVNGTNVADGLLANLRLQPKEGVTDTPTLTVENGSEFCNWAEENVTVTSIIAR